MTDSPDREPSTEKPTVDAGGLPAPSASENLPLEIGGFRILGKLGEGGMGIVYEAEQKSPSRHVALKVVRGGHFVDESYLRMFRREAESLARLVHPNIAAIYEVGRTDDGQHFFTMELVSGRTLGAYVRDRLGGDHPTREQLRERLRLFETICRAVNYAHQRGVIHRDLKPSNIVVAESGDVKILDFGLARITDTDVAAATVVSEIGTIRGTLPYMSPEQARGDSRDIDLRADVYSLGIILYEILSGGYPYDTQNVSMVMALRAIVEAAPSALKTAEGGESLDADLQTIVSKALEKEPDRRYQSGAALAEDVERYLAVGARSLEVAAAETLLADVFRMKGRLIEARALGDDAFHIARAHSTPTARAEMGAVDFRRVEIDSLRVLAEVATDQADYKREEALERERLALALARALHPDRHPERLRVPFASRNCQPYGHPGGNRAGFPGEFGGGAGI